MNRIFFVVSARHFFSSVVTQRTPTEFSTQLFVRIGSSGVTFELDVAKTSSRPSPSFYLMPQQHPAELTTLSSRCPELPPCSVRPLNVLTFVPGFSPEASPFIMNTLSLQRPISLSAFERYPHALPFPKCTSLGPWHAEHSCPKMAQSFNKVAEKREPLFGA